MARNRGAFAGHVAGNRAAQIPTTFRDGTTHGSVPRSLCWHAVSPFGTAKGADLSRPAYLRPDSVLRNSQLRPPHLAFLRAVGQEPVLPKIEALRPQFSSRQLSSTVALHTLFPLRVLV